VHEYAGRRLAWLTRRLSPARGASLERLVESGALAAVLRFYQLAAVLFAPNPELCTLLERSAGTPCHLMQRGVDTSLFRPARRTRPDNDGDVVLGYVGRLSIEKNVSLLLRVERELHARGIRNVRFLIVGHGSEQKLLRRELKHATFTGVLGGEALAAAYADMDLLVFPSHTDTFGNVVLEALACGVPAIVTPDGGPKYIVRDGETGHVVPDEEFSSAIAALIGAPDRLAQMRRDARAYASTCSWNSVFDRVYGAYGSVIREKQLQN
jgi:glycosyltransferase involved in cell wall biosynthesis